MALTQTVIDRLVENERSSIRRAQTLYTRIAANGATSDGAGFRPLMYPDRRDAATFIFFEVAADYEHFCTGAFEIEVRKRFKVEPKRAMAIMGSSDRGLSGVMGWGAPRTVQGRARNLFGMTGFFANLESHIGQNTYLTLTQAHKVRNRVAHRGLTASKDFREVLPQLQVPAQSRQGLSVGRLLMDYPTAASVDDRWFHRFLRAYLLVVDEFHHQVKV